MRTLRPLALLTFAAMLNGCPDTADTESDLGTDTDSAEGTDADTSPDRDTEPDTDPDTEPDTDPDTDPDTEPDTDPDTSIATSDLTGTHSYAATLTGTGPNDEVINSSCAAEFTVSGTEFVGDCNGCDWAFELTATETSNDCDGDLPLVYSLQPVGVDNAAPVVVFWSTYTSYYGSYSDVFATGVLVEDAYGTFIAAGTFVEYPIDGVNYGSGGFSLVDTALDWNTAAELDVVEFRYVNDFCDSEVLDSELTAPLAGAGLNGTLPCEGGEFDVFAFEATAGSPVSISVDTVDAGNAFDSGVRIIAPSGCATTDSDDAFDCTFAPEAFQCSGLIFTPDETGTHLAIVQNFGSCTDTSIDTIGEYIIVADGTTLVAAGDNVLNDIVLETTNAVSTTTSVTLNEAP
jgi:hypothetical protein